MRFDQFEDWLYLLSKKYRKCKMASIIIFGLYNVLTFKCECAVDIDGDLNQ